MVIFETSRELLLCLCSSEHSNSQCSLTFIMYCLFIYKSYLFASCSYIVCLFIHCVTKSGFICYSVSGRLFFFYSLSLLSLFGLFIGDLNQDLNSVKLLVMKLWWILLFFKYTTMPFTLCTSYIHVFLLHISQQEPWQMVSTGSEYQCRL